MVENVLKVVISTLMNVLELTVEKTMETCLTIVFTIFVQTVEPAHGITMGTLVNAMQLTLEKTMEALTDPCFHNICTNGGTCTYNHCTYTWRNPPGQKCEP